MEKLAIWVWIAVILSFTGWIGWAIAGIGFLFYTGCWLYVEIKKDIEFRKWNKV